jgi:ABC-type uncharacterized transport system ATPase component
VSVTTLELAKRYNSIQELPANLKLPSFALITGLNGAGKSHLLDGIVAGHIIATIDGKPLNAQTDIKHASWASLVPQDSGPYAESMLDQERFQLATSIVQQSQQFKNNILEYAKSNGVSGKALSDARILLSMTAEQLIPHVQAPYSGDAAHKAIWSQVKAWDAHLLQHYAHSAEQKAICELVKSRSGLPLMALDMKDFTGVNPANWGTSDIFQHQFARTFIQYRALWRSNRSRLLDQLENRAVDSVLTEQQFRTQHGEPPWEFVNTAMQDSGLDFVINEPDRHAPGMFEPKLMKRSTGADVAFSALSSGEKVLMSLALSLYYANDKRTLANYPKLLLLDEIDAPLHPSMSRHLVRIIENTLVLRYGINVIATTHAPATVALTPETAIHAMDASRPGVHKTTKSQALNILMRDVPSLALSYEGRRQVFVESKIDAEIYGLLWQALKSKVTIDRSLEFLAPGVKATKTDSDVHTGCAVVKHLVKELNNAGVSSAHGLIDWDKKNTSNGQVIVLSPGVRYGLENLLLDPRLIGALLLHSPGLDDVRRVALGLTGLTYSNYCCLDGIALAPIVHAIARECFGELAETKVTVNYVDGKSLDTSSYFLSFHGHTLAEEVLPGKFPWLKRFGTNNGALMKYMADAIAIDAPGLLPTDVFTAFEMILDTPTHQGSPPRPASAGRNDGLNTFG